MGEVDLAHEFATFQRSAWRLCTLNEYDVGDAEAASIAEWTRTGRVIEPANGWLPIVRAARERGASVGRVQVLSRPLTEYARWLLAVYLLNVAEGEDVRVAYRDEYPDGLTDLHGDFWIFDGARVARLSYGRDGRFIVAWDESHGIDRYRQVRDLAVAVARPMGHAAVA